MKNLLKSVVCFYIKILKYLNIVKDVIPAKSYLNLDITQNMPIPDEVFFSKDNYGKSIYFEDVRKITNKNELILLLKNRLDSILIEQVKLNANESPFPLAAMACIGIETLGQISIKRTGNQLDSKYFIDTLKKFDTSFGKQLTPSFEEKMHELWGSSGKILKIENFAELIYTYFRNSMIHGYHGKGVYLSNEDTDSFIPHENGYLIINPGWLWNKFKQIYNEVFSIIMSNPASNERRNCLKYIEELIKK